MKESTYWPGRSTVKLLDNKSVAISIAGKCEIWYHEKQIMILGMFAVRLL
jgi:hypothetical protein